MDGFFEDLSPSVNHVVLGKHGGIPRPLREGRSTGMLGV